VSEPDVDVPPNLRGGVFANDVRVYGDLDESTIDFIRLDPEEPLNRSACRPCRRFALVHTEGEDRSGAVSDVNTPRELPPGWRRMRLKLREPTPEEAEYLRRYREKRDAVLKQRLRDLYGR
jgi:hypothetical protein